MAPAITSPKPTVMGKNGSRLADSMLKGREVTPPVVQTPTIAKGDAELASLFKSDLTDMRNLVTCSICDQLLYEPWTLGCGHTYCYTCLCSWFKDKRKKTCPECRTTVKQMPAPAFLVKQMVEIFIKRGELLPSDESIEQHQKKRAEEIADVDKDRNGAEGLFKGMFPANKRELIFDDGDGVYRCPRCLTEHEGGPTCANCDLAVELGYDLSDMDDDFDPDDLENLEVDLDDAEFGGGLGQVGYSFGQHIRRHMHPHAHHAHFHHAHFHHHHHHEDDSEESESDSDLDRDIDEEDEEDEDDDNSLQDFVVPDTVHSQPPSGARLSQIGSRQPINISDDESDEGGAISNRRSRRRGTQIVNLSSSPSAPSVVSVSGSAISEGDDAMLQRAGWSPLDQGSESDVEGQDHYPAYANGEGNTEGSDTETIGHGASDDDSDRSETPRYEYPLYAGRTSDDDDDNDDDDDDDEGSELGADMDRDGDTEMSVSPSAEQFRSRSVSTDAYGYEMGWGEPQSRNSSLTGDAYGYGGDDSGASRASRSLSENSEQYGYVAEQLGQANQIHEIEDDSSESSIVPPSRRQRRRHPESARVQQYYDPRISMMLAEHQQIRGAQDPQANLAQLDDQMRRPPVVEPASRTRRLTAYRGQPQRRTDPLRSSRLPSATRIISSSNRMGRLPPQYQRRN